MLRLDGKRVRAGGAASVRGLLSDLKISPQEALVRVDGRMRPDDFPLAGAKRIEVIRVVFGG